MEEVFPLPFVTVPSLRAAWASQRKWMAVTFVNLWVAFLNNAASEQSARMNAMENASKNAGEIVDKLTLQYN